MEEIFFVSGLPRSGSTVLMNLLAQNENVFCTPTSGLHQILYENKNIWNSVIEHKADKNAGNDENLVRVLGSILKNYHNTDKPYVIDKCRGWGQSIEMVEKVLGRKIKIIAPVREISEILASFEVLYRNGIYKFPAPGPMPECISTSGRVDHWASLSGEVGIAYSVLRDAFQRGLGDRFLLVDYNYLTNEPEITMEGIWKFLGLPPAIHDFNNIINQTPEDDSVYNYVNLHTIKSKMVPNKPKAIEILGHDICNNIKGYEFWL